MQDTIAQSVVSGMICNYCGKEFQEAHFNQRLCSPECKRKAIRRAKNKYKKTEKGKATNERWINSEKRKENERRYMQKPRRKKLAVQAQKRYLDNSPEAREKKRIRDKEYARTEHGRETNRRAQERYRNTENGRLVRKITKARRRNAPGNFTPEEWMAKLEKCGNACVNCGATENIEIDHIIPISAGGENTIDNVQPLCRHCNATKGASIW